MACIDSLVTEAADILRHTRIVLSSDAQALESFRAIHGARIRRRRDAAILARTERRGRTADIVVADAGAIVDGAVSSFSWKGVAKTTALAIVTIISSSEFRQALSNEQYSTAANMLLQGASIAAAGGALIQEITCLLRNHCTSAAYNSALGIFMVGMETLLILGSYLTGSGTGFSGLWEYIKENSGSILGRYFTCGMTYLFSLSGCALVGLCVGALTVEYLSRCKARWDQGQNILLVIFGGLGDLGCDIWTGCLEIGSGMYNMMKQLVCLDVHDYDQRIMQTLSTVPETDPLAIEVADLSLRATHDEFTCGITQEVVRDPVFVFGNVYERSAIRGFMSQTTLNPVTGQIQVRIMNDPAGSGRVLTERDVHSAPERYRELLGQYLRLRLIESRAHRPPTPAEGAIQRISIVGALVACMAY